MDYNTDEVLAAFYKPPSPPKLIDDLFKNQRAFFEDPAIYKSACTSRRAGKTWLGGEGLFESSKRSQKGTYTLYISLTRESAKRIVWPILYEQKQKFNIDADPFESTLTYKFKNGGDIVLYGADQDNLIERLRGLKINRAIIDEAQSFRPTLLEKLIDEVIDPALMDTGGDCWVFGTPSAIPAGFFYDLSHSAQSGWSNHSWTVWDNPHMELAEERLKKTLERKNWTVDNPTIQREWFGRWVLDEDSLLIKFSRSKNVYSGGLPDGHDWLSVLGIDYGWNDKTAVTVVYYSPTHPNCFVKRSHAKGEMTVSQISTFVRRFIDTEKQLTNIVADTGGLGKTITEELKTRFGINIKPAEKKEKLTALQLLNSDMIAGKVKIHESADELLHQIETLQRADNGLEDPSMPNDLVDSFLYAWREAQHYAYREPVAEPSRDSNAYQIKLEEEEAEAIEREQAELLEQTEINLFDGEDYDQYF